jgi:two-component system chemotaxis sensor kinase CheA
MNALLIEFINEARELLEDTGTNLLALEKNPDDTDILNISFRAIHTLKGDSGLFEFEPITRVLHTCEDILDQLREGNIQFDAYMVDALLKACDLISSWLGSLEEDECLPLQASSMANDVIKKLQVFLSDNTDLNPNTVSSVNTISWLQDIPEQAKLDVTERATLECMPLCAVEYTPDDQCFFRGEDPICLVQQIQNSLWMEIIPVKPFPSLEELDPYACNVSFHVLCLESVEELEYLFRFSRNQTVISEICPEDLLEEALPSDNDQSSNDCLHSILRETLIALDVMSEADVFEGRVKSTSEVLRSAATSVKMHAMVDAINQAENEAIDQAVYIPIQSCIRKILDSLNKPAQARTAMAEQRVTDSSVNKDPLAEPRTANNQVLKVDQARLDRIMALIGEMVVAKNSLPYLSQRAETTYGVRSLAREIKEQYVSINRITQEMQDAIMEVRMLPVSHVLQRFPRLVRDLSKKLDKKIEFVTVGEETEADKNMIEALSDPLIHIIRNSIDHGIETPAERLTVGKPEFGTIKVRSSQENGRVEIEISDDGHGINSEAVKNKAIKQGLIGEEEALLLSERELINLVFRPGFSTMEQVSELSGRGVGMDVVRSGVERAGGTVSLNSRIGQGTTVNISLPMTMATSHVVLVEADTQSFGVPIEMVVETVKIPRSSIFKIKQREVFVLRERTVPLVQLRKALHLRENTANADDECAVLVVRIMGGNIGIMVDDFHDNVEVILKPLEGIMTSVKGFTNTALLGDGSVLLILDLKELVQCQ